MSLLLKYKDRLDDPTLPWKEDDLQAHCVRHYRQHSNYKKTYALAGDQNAGKRSLTDGSRRRACGMEAGEPDLRFYFLGGRTLFFEMKRKGGKLSKKQEERIALLESFGFWVWVIKADCPANALEQMETIFKSLGGLGEGEYSDDEIKEAIQEVAEAHGSKEEDKQMNIGDYPYALD